jgi:hypothetical protein
MEQPSLGPVTFGDLARDGKLLWVYCTECYHERDLDPSAVPLPAETPVPSVGKRMKCSACGSRNIDARPELYPGGIVAMPEHSVSNELDLQHCFSTAAIAYYTLIHARVFAIRLSAGTPDPR